MKYKNVTKILPQSLVEEIQEYVQGEYVYIPKKEKCKKKWGENTNFKREIKIRNVRIYEKYLEGEQIVNIAQIFKLSEKSIRRIIKIGQEKDKEHNNYLREVLNINWNISESMNHIHTSVWEIDNKYTLKKYTDIDEMERNISIVNQLFKQKNQFLK